MTVVLWIVMLAIVGFVIGRSVKGGNGVPGVGLLKKLPFPSWAVAGKGLRLILLLGIGVAAVGLEICFHPHAGDIKEWAWSNWLVIITSCIFAYVLTSAFAERRTAAQLLGWLVAIGIMLYVIIPVGVLIETPSQKNKASLVPFGPGSALVRECGWTENHARKKGRLIIPAHGVTPRLTPLPCMRIDMFSIKPEERYAYSIQTHLWNQKECATQLGAPCPPDYIYVDATNMTEKEVAVLYIEVPITKPATLDEFANPDEFG
jgi:hypothetical protein